MAARAALATAGLFAGLTAEQREVFVPLAGEQAVPSGAYLFRLGDAADTLYVLRSGIVHLTMPIAMKSSDREVVVEEAHDGDTLAWSALIKPYRCTMSARADTDLVLLAFDPHKLSAAFAAHPDAGLQVLHNLATVIARRLQVTHAMWTREVQRAVIETFG